MLDPFTPLLHVHAVSSGLGEGPNQAAAQWLATGGVVMILLMALWSAGALTAGLWPLVERAERALHHQPEPGGVSRR